MTFESHSYSQPDHTFLLENMPASGRPCWTESCLVSHMDHGRLAQYGCDGAHEETKRASSYSLQVSAFVIQSSRTVQTWQERGSPSSLSASSWSEMDKAATMLVYRILLSANSIGKGSAWVSFQNRNRHSGHCAMSSKCQPTDSLAGLVMDLTVLFFLYSFFPGLGLLKGWKLSHVLGNWIGRFLQPLMRTNSAWSTVQNNLLRLYCLSKKN